MRRQRSRNNLPLARNQCNRKKLPPRNPRRKGPRKRQETSIETEPLTMLPEVQIDSTAIIETEIQE